MPRKTAGYRYPFATTAAREHQCEMCDVVGAIASRASSGAEEWGTGHRMPPMVTDDRTARRIRQQLFRGRGCQRLTRKHGQLSLGVKWLTEDDQEVNGDPVKRPEGYVLVVRVWSRSAAKKEIARRVKDGEELSYNVLKKVK